MSGVAKSYQNTKESPQDAEAVARPDLTAETLAMLEAQRKVLAYTHEHWHQQDALLAHAAACVREVAALRARPALPADVFRWWAVVRDSDDKVVELLKDEAEADARAQGWMNHTGAGYSAFPVLAHLQRQGTPVVVTEAMVEAAARAQYELEHTDLPWERCGSLFADGYREDARAVLTAALAARGEGE